jgi:hypothetical protein
MATSEINSTVFEPDYKTKQRWLSTRKNEHHSETVHLNGFYQDSTSKNDKILFWVAFFIEILVAFFILFGGLGKRDFGMKMFAIFDVIALIVLDGAGAYFVHMMKGKYCELDNKIIAEPTQKRAYELKKTNKWAKPFGIFCIILSAVFKAIGVLLFTKIRMTIFVVLLLLYVFVIYIHIAHTGYYFAGLLFRKARRKQEDIFSLDKHEGKKSIYEARILDHFFESKFDLKINEAAPREVGHHKIEFIGNEEGTYKYKLITVGVLEDSEIISFLAGYNKDQQKIISKECLYHQVFGIHTHKKNEE